MNCDDSNCLHRLGGIGAEALRAGSICSAAPGCQLAPDGGARCCCICSNCNGGFHPPQKCPAI